jgi:hypothetical protein
LKDAYVDGTKIEANAKGCPSFDLGQPLEISMLDSSSEGAEYVFFSTSTSTQPIS